MTLREKQSNVSCTPKQGKARQGRAGKGRAGQGKAKQRRARRSNEGQGGRQGREQVDLSKSQWNGMEYSLHVVQH